MQGTRHVNNVASEPQSSKVKVLTSSTNKLAKIPSLTSISNMNTLTYVLSRCKKYWIHQLMGGVRRSLQAVSSSKLNEYDLQAVSMLDTCRLNK